MSHKETEVVPAAEQYELRETPAYLFAINRRRFFQIMGSGLAIAFTAYSATADALSDGPKTPEDQVAAWIHVGADGKVTIYTGKAEVGQNIRTSLAQIVAEELRVSMGRVHMVLGDTDLTPYDRGTFGSRSIPYMGPQLRKAAATAREALLDMAAKKWKTERANLRITDGVIYSQKTNRQFGDIGTLTNGNEILRPVDDNAPVTPARAWKIAGTSVPKVNGADFVTGRHRYVSDMRLPGMLYGKMLRAPAFHATLKSVDSHAVEQIAGARVVRDGDFVGVVAPDSSTATRALAAIRAEWEMSPQPGRADLFAHLLNTAEKRPGGDDIIRGVNAALASAAVRLEQTFHVDYIAHAPLEPRAGLARWENGKLTVWTGTQRPFGVQEALAEVFQMPKENVRVIMPDTGSGYGGKHTGEAGIEAARLSLAAGKPVKVVWTREEEFTWAYFRPAGVIQVRAGADGSGLLTAWEFHNFNSGGAAIETPYVVKNQRIQYHEADSPLRQGSYRGLASTANVFARECAMDDLAADLKMDPLAFRVRNLREERMIDVLRAAAEKFGWSTFREKPGHGIGIACGTEKGGFTATCAEIAFDPDEENIKVLRAVTAFECGAIINPRHLENQIQGAVVQGLGGALFELIDFRDGKILNARFSDYRVPRFGDIPWMETVMLDRKDLPSAGAGEAPIIGIAPAIRNAIAHATGQRLYTLPLVPDGLKPGRKLGMR